MDNSSIPLVAIKEDRLDVKSLKSKEVTKSIDHSPARSSVNSVKSTVGPKAGGNKLSGKVESKSLVNLTRTGNQKNSPAPNRQNASPVTTKSPSSLTLPPEKSKIPTMKKTVFNNSTTKPKTVAAQKTPAVQPSRVKIAPPKESKTDYKRPDPKQTFTSRANSKLSINKAEPVQAKRTASSISRSSFATTASVSSQGKRIPKSQSARASSETPASLTNKRSRSNVSTHSTPCARRKNEFETNLRKKVSTAGDHKKEENIKNNLAKDQEELLENIGNEPKPKAPESVNDFKSKMKKYMDQWYASFKSELKGTKKIDDLDRKEYNENMKQEEELFSLIDDWCATRNGNSLDEIKKEIEEGKESYKQLETKYNDLIKQHEELGKETTDTAKKEDNTKEFQKKIKTLEKQVAMLKTAAQTFEKEKETQVAEKDHLEEELKGCKDSVAMANKKLHDTDQQLKHEKKEVKSKIEIIKKLETELVDKKKLETDLAEMTSKLEKLQSQINKRGENDCVEHLKRIAELENMANCLETDRKALQRDNEKLQQEITDFESVREKLLETETKLNELQAAFDEREKIIETAPDYSKEVQLEFAKFRQADSEKRREIEKLKIELSKTQFNICQLEQQVQRDQQLLEVRSGLINSLQTNEKTHRIHMEELFAQVGEKNNVINELNSELQTKSEEFRNLFTTLSAKQMEVANQEHIIKLLEESNERSQMLRVKQEEKIGRLEEELAHLKQTIAIYNDNVLAGRSGRHLLHNPVLPPRHVENNENFYYYVSQRKRKRQVDINVKKYEA